MRKIFLLFSITFLMIVIAACGEETDDAKVVGQAFIEELYVVEDPNLELDKMDVEGIVEFQNKFSSYTTDSEFETLRNERIFSISQKTANKLNSQIDVEDITIEKGEGDDRFEHTFTIVLTDQDNEKTKEEASGQMTILETDEGYKIDRYYDNAQKALLEK